MSRAYAAARQAPLSRIAMGVRIVIATHGRTSLRRLLLSITAKRVVRHAPWPVLAVREFCSPQALRELPFSGKMNRALLLSTRIIIACATAVTILVGMGCENLRGLSKPGSFASVRPLLELNCVHCHGANRLSHMPAFRNGRELAGLIGRTKWIVPGHPERSRFFRAVTSADEQPGAMPPTGHAISKSEVEELRTWIAAGASVPEDTTVEFVARGEGPRSR